MPRHTTTPLPPAVELLASQAALGKAVLELVKESGMLKTRRYRRRATSTGNGAAAPAPRKRASKPVDEAPARRSRDDRDREREPRFEE